MGWSLRRTGVALALYVSCATGHGRAQALAAPTTESWDAVYIAGSKVGHIHTFIEPVKDRGRDLLRVRVDMSLTIKRLNSSSTMKMQYGTIEAPDGEVLRLDTRTLASDQEFQVHGDVVKGKMKLIFEGTGQRQEKEIDWASDVRGPYAAEQSMSKKPMKPGEVRELKMFMPDLNRVVDIKLNATTREDVKLGGAETRNLVRIDQTTRLDNMPRSEFDITLWADDGGQVLKSKTDTLGGMVTFRTTREGAMTPDVGGAGFDQILHSVIKVARKIPRPESSRDIRYRITLQGEDPAQVLPDDRRQTHTAGASKNEILLEVKTAGPTEGTADAGEIDPVFLQPNPMINCRDGRVLDHTRKAIGNATDPWEKAKRIEHWVAKNLKDKNFETGFASATEVARNLSGDCTEHGVLVAAMCRAAGVPSRVVVGLVYADNLGGFGYHLWNEVHVNHRWVAIDASFEQDDVDAVHIKLADASLDGVSPFEAFLPIVKVLGKMTIEPVEIR